LSESNETSASFFLPIFEVASGSEDLSLSALILIAWLLMKLKD
jgi:hypothetical protein